MNGSNRLEYKDNIYVAPNGRRYRIYGNYAHVLPHFGMSDEGLLVYQYEDTQEEHDFTVSNEGDLQSELEGLFIDSEGYLAYNVEYEEIIEPDTTELMKKYIRLVRQHNKRIRLKVSLLNNLYQEVESITGKIKGAPAYEIDSESDIRRTCSLTLSIPAKEQIEIDFEKTWNNRMVELSCGIYGWEENEYTWFSLGRMLMVSGNTVYNATTQEVKLNLVDLMASMTQERGNQLGVDTLIPAGSDVDGALIAVVTTYSNFKLYNVCQFEDDVPYDITSSIGDYPIELLQNIINLFPYYEFFYDVNGVFTVRKIPTKTNDPIDIPASVLDDLIISESKNVDFSQIKNTTELHGRELTGEYTATACVTNIDTYNVTISQSYTEPTSGETFTVVPDSTSISGQKMKIQTSPAYPIVSESSDGTTYTPIAAGAMEAGTPYVLRFFEEKYILQGEFYIRCIVQEISEEPDASAKAAYKTANNCQNVQWIVNPDSPYACTINQTTNRIEGEMKQVLTGGDFSSIYTTELAYERASYENWTKCRMQDTVDVEMVLVPWMDVNDKIQYTSPITGELTTWLVNSISYDFNNWTMTVKASHFYPYYPFWE